MGWSDTKGKGGGGNRSDDFLQITPNTSKVVHILLPSGEEPTSYWTHFISESNRAVVCPGKSSCPACKAGTYKARRRHAVNVYDHESKKIKILEAGNQVMQQLHTIMEHFGGFDAIDVSIKRTGEKLNTQYMVIPMPRAKGDIFTCAGKIHDLDTLCKPTASDEIQRLMMGGGGDNDEFPPREANTNTPTPIGNVVNRVASKVMVVEDDDRVEFGEPEPKSKLLPTERPPLGVDSNSVVLQFGKYKGKTLKEIADEDFNYAVWVSQNIADEGIKNAAKEVVDNYDNRNLKAAPKPVTHTVTATGEAVSAPTKPEMDLLLGSIYNLINTNPNLKSNFQIVVNKMKEATANPTNPGGKTLLQEYTLEELNRLHDLLAKG